MSPPTKNPVEDDSGREDFNLKRDAVNNYNQFLVSAVCMVCTKYVSYFGTAA